MNEILVALGSWRSFLLAVAVFGFAPGVVLRLIVRIYPPADERRKELLAELYAVPYWKRPFWVAQQLEVALFEGSRLWAFRAYDSILNRLLAVVFRSAGRDETVADRGGG